MVQQQ
jgi:hypothetical protein